MTTPARPDRDRSVPVAVPPAQRAEWLLDRVEPGHPSAVRRRVYAVEGDLDTTALRTAWTALLSRHAVLRTVLAAGPGVRGPVAEVPAEPAPGSFVDLGLVCRTGRVTAADLAAGIVARPLPLGGPPARLVVGRTGAVEHVLVLQVHRAVADEESMAVLVGELAHDCAAALYERPLLRALPALPPPAAGPRGPGAGPFR
ncbi:MAG: condensation domain-containing protein, partial [Pseudonocardiales bacterium]|nr:condensation domain-containing protein [Pseudonocardiales bacterium]